MLIRDSMLCCSLTSAAVWVWVYAVSFGMLLTACLSLLAAAAATMEEDVGVAAMGVGGEESIAESGVDCREEDLRSRGAGLDEPPFLLLPGAIMGLVGCLCNDGVREG